MNFNTIDFETANPNYASVCAIGFTTVRDGRIEKQGSWLCRPPAGHRQFNSRNVQIHGISAATVASEPTFEDRIPDLLALLSNGLPVIAHNAKFDMNVLRQALAACGRSHDVATYYCTMEWSRLLLPELPKHRLPNVCEHYRIKLDNHHEAGSDALAAAKITLCLAQTAKAATITELDTEATSRGHGYYR